MYNTLLFVFIFGQFGHTFDKDIAKTHTFKGSQCALVFAGWPVWRHEMQHVIKSRIGRTVRYPRRNRDGHNRKRFFVATLLTVAVGVQLVTVGRYTVSYIFAVPLTANKYSSEAVSIIEVPSTANKYSPEAVSIIEENRDNKTKPLFQLTPDESTPNFTLTTVNNRICFVEGMELGNWKTSWNISCGFPCKDRKGDRRFSVLEFRSEFYN